MPSSNHQPISAGIITALVGYTSSFAVVIAGLTAVGATPTEAASALLALCVTQGLGMLWLTHRFKMPIILVWSTPGVALLAGMHSARGGWPAVVGAFLIVGVAYIVTGLMPVLGRAIGRIPTPVAQAMLAGVLLELCLEPVSAFVDHPITIAPIVLVWLIGVRFAPRWAVRISAPRPARIQSTSQPSARPSRRARMPGTIHGGAGSLANPPAGPISYWASFLPRSPRWSRSRQSASSPRSPGSLCSVRWPMRFTRR